MTVDSVNWAGNRAYALTSHGAFLLGLLVAMMIGIGVLITYKYYGFSSLEAVFGATFGLITGLNKWPERSLTLTQALNR